MKNLILIIALLAPGLVLAEERLYVGGAVGEARCSGPAGCNGHTNTSKVFAGIRVTRNFAVELGLQKYNDSAVAEDAIKIDYSAIGILPVTESIELFGKLGIGVWDGVIAVGNNSDSVGGRHHLFSIGTNVNVTQNATLRIEIERTVLNSLKFNNNLEVTSVTAGLIYNF